MTTRRLVMAAFPYALVLVLGIFATVPFVDYEGRLILEPDFPIGEIRLYYDALRDGSWATLPVPGSGVYFEGHSLLYGSAVHLYETVRGLWGEVPPFRQNAAVTVGLAALSILLVAVQGVRHRDPTRLWLLFNLLLFSALGAAAFKYERGGYHLVPLYLYALAIAAGWLERAVAARFPGRAGAVGPGRTDLERAPGMAAVQLGLALPVGTVVAAYAGMVSQALQRPSSIMRTRFEPRDWIAHLHAGRLRMGRATAGRAGLAGRHRALRLPLSGHGSDGALRAAPVLPAAGLVRRRAVQGRPQGPPSPFPAASGTWGGGVGVGTLLRGAGPGLSADRLRRPFSCGDERRTGRMASRPWAFWPSAAPACWGWPGRVR